MKMDRAMKIDRRRAQIAASVGLIVLGVALFSSSSSLGQYPWLLLNTGVAGVCGVVLARLAVKLIAGRLPADGRPVRSGRRGR